MTTGFEFPNVYHVGVDRVLSIEPTRRTQLRVLRGRIWLTQDGGPAGTAEDLVLEAGDQIALAPHATTVVQALRAANLQFVHAAGERRLAGWRDVGGALARAHRAGAALRQRLQLGRKVTLTAAP